MSRLNVDLELVQKYNVAGPRYTSYPPATKFTGALTWPELAGHILEMERRVDVAAVGGVFGGDRPAVRVTLRAYGPLHVLQIGYNMLERQADALLHWAQAEQIGTLIRVPLAKGMLTGKYSGPQAVAMPPGDHRYERFQRPGTMDGLQKLSQLGFLQTPRRSMVQAALRFVLDHPGVSSVIAGAKTRQQVEENTATSALPALAPDERSRALAIADTIGTPNWSR